MKLFDTELFKSWQGMFKGLYPSGLINTDLVSVQPMKGPVGNVFHMDIIHSTGPIPVELPDSELWVLWESYAPVRDDRGPLPEGMRWLQPTDELLAGDEYWSEDRWTMVAGPDCSMTPSPRVPSSLYGWTPRGLIEAHRLDQDRTHTVQDS